MSLETITDNLRQKAKHNPPIGAKVKIDLGDDGVIMVDSRKAPTTVTHDDGEADTTLTLKLETLKGIVTGAIDPNFAFMTGKLKVRGNMGVALKLNALLED